MQQATIRSGRAVGALATELFAGGVQVAADHEHHDAAVRETEGLMANPDVPAIFEAGFAHDGVRVRVDVLERGDAGRWNVIEVKSGLDVKEINVDDLALQCWVMRGCGVDIGRASLMTLNRSYHRQGSLELERLFVRHDRTDEVTDRLDRVTADLEVLTCMLCASSPPAVRPAQQCWHPFPCPYQGHCFDEAGGGHPLTELPGLSAAQRAQLAARGICDIAGLPAGEPLSDVQARVRECVLTGEERVSEQLAGVLDQLEHPIHHLRIGIVRPAVPRFGGMRPYQLLPYVWSDHVDREGSLEHRDWMCTERRDPCDHLAQTLLGAAGECGSVCTYGPLERRVVTALAARLPDLAAPLGLLADRLVDLQGVVMAHYYHPDLHGSFAAERLAAVLGVPPCRGQTSLRDEYAAGVVYDDSHTVIAEERDVCQERELRFFGDCTEALQKLRCSLRARAD